MDPDKKTGVNPDAHEGAALFFKLCLVPNVGSVSGMSILDCPFSFLQRLFIPPKQIKVLCVALYVIRYIHHSRCKFHF
jgi:hypothetical protein